MSKEWMRRVLACVVCGVMTVGMVWAERVSQEDAALVANNFMNVTPSSAHGQKAPAKRMVMKVAAAPEENQFYIYENADGEGWVMVAANDVVRPILAYSETGHFRTDNMPSNVRSWLTGYNKQIKHVERNYPVASEDIQQEWKKLRSGARRAKASVVVSPLIKTGWDQDSPYWNLCPQKGSTYCYTGCVATAMAQVMKYWEWPKQGTGSHSIKYNSKTYTANFGETTYDWANMKNSYSGSSTSTQKTAVATLMYHCGIAVDMQYGTANEGGSAAYTIDYNGYFSSKGKMCAETALKQFFGYNSSTVKGYYRDGDSGTGMQSWTKTKWIAMLKEELDAARPIMYAGCGYETPGDEESVYGHSFVCDGYDSNDMFHFNWGWGNWCDGYYDVDAMVTNDPGSGGGNGEYNYYQDIIIGIQPPVIGHSVIKDATGCTITCANFAKNDEAFTATITPTDASYDFTSISVKLGSTTLTQTTHYTLSADKKTLTIKASAITGDASNDLTITAEWTKNRYLYNLIGENCTPEEAEGTVAMNGVALNLTILPASGYTLNNADCWEVMMGESTLTFGTDFTYNASNGAFTIAEVTGDVVIFVYGGKAVNWMANGTLFATTMTSSDKYVLPTTTPSIDCEGREFYGWCATENYSSETEAPTIIKEGDAATKGNVFYAVFAKKGTGGSSSWTLVADASSLKVGDKLVIANKAQNATAGALSSQILGSVESTFDNDNISSLGAGTLEFTLGGTSGAWTLSTSNGLLGATDAKKLAWGNGTTTWSISISSGDATIQNGTSSYGKILYNVNNPRFTTYTSSPSASMLLPQIYRKSGGSSYSNFTTTCAAPCEGELTSITLNTENVKKVFTEGDAFTYDGLVVTANYDECESKTVTPTSVSTPDMNQVGEQTITVTYESKSAEYTINVTALPTYAIRFYNNGVQVGETQNVKKGQAAAKPATDPEACEGYTFVGWVASAISPETESTPTIVTNFTATKDQDYYAVYSRTEEGEGGSRNVTYTASNLYSDQETAETKEVEGVTFGYAKGGNTQNAPKYYSNGTSVRMYANNTLTISAASAITAIQFTYGTTTAGFTANVGALNGSSWTGNAESIVFTANGKHWIQAIVVTVGGGSSSTTYYTTAPDCSTPEPCELISISLYTEDVKKVFTEGETFSYDGLVVTANYSNCASKDVMPTSVSTPDLSTAGDKTVTVSYTENEITRQKTYSITVKEPNQYTIAFYDNGVQIGDGQVVIEGKQPEVPSDPEPACSAYTFVGWWIEELAANNTESKEWISDFTATQDQIYYAIYKKTEGGESGPTASVTFKDADQESPIDASLTAGKIREDIVETETGIDSYSGSKVYASPNGAKLGSSKANGQLDIVLSSAVTTNTITINAKQYGTDTGSLSVTVNENTDFGSAQMPSSEGGVLTFTDDEITINSITITTSSKRAYVKSVTIGTGSTSTTYYSSTVSCGGGTAVENTSAEQVAVKALMNGQIVIIRGDAVYSITGVRIQ